MTFLVQQGAGPWIEIPLWLPSSDEDSSDLLDVSIARALAAGITFRPLAVTVRDTLAWDQTRPADTRAPCRTQTRARAGNFCRHGMQRDAATP